MVLIYYIFLFEYPILTFSEIRVIRLPEWVLNSQPTIHSLKLICAMLSLNALYHKLNRQWFITWIDYCDISFQE